MTAPPSGEGRCKARILVVEDEWLIADDVRCNLERAGYEVVGPASSVSRALRLIEESALDAAVLDINLHGEESYPIAHALSARGLPFAFLTGYGVGELHDLCRDHPCLQKPITSSGLLKVVEKLFAEI